MSPRLELMMSNDRQALGRSAEIATELRLGLPGDFGDETLQEKKRLFWEIVGGARTDAPAKNQVVGWPPVCLHRKRAVASNEKEVDSSKPFVKVSMDGAIYLRKIELGAQGGYVELALAVEKLFVCAGIGLSEDSKEDDDDTSEYMLIYEDKDGDWTLVGDVPWKMFLGSCKRLRVTKRSDVKHTRFSRSRGHTHTSSEESDTNEFKKGNDAAAPF